MSGLGLTFLRRGGQAHPTAGSDYIKFEDSTVFDILMANGVSSDGVGITKDDAARVTTIGTWFQKSNITSFNEFQFFVGVTSVVGNYLNGAFYGCVNLRELTLPPYFETINSYAFRDCTSLAKVNNLSFVRNIYSGAFNGCPLNEMLEIYLPTLVGTLTNRTFSSMASPHRITNLGNITGITGTSYADNVFGSGATHLRLPKTMVSMSNYAFRNLKNCQECILEAETPPTGAKAFAETTFPIYVPDASVEVYKTNEEWASYSSRILPLSQYSE